MQSQEIKYIIQMSRSKWQPCNMSVPLDPKVTKDTRLILNIIYVWKLNQTVLELDFRAVKFVFFPRRNLSPLILHYPIQYIKNYWVRLLSNYNIKYICTICTRLYTCLTSITRFAWRGKKIKPNSVRIRF
jgi:hypothetical protein